MRPAASDAQPAPKSGIKRFGYLVFNYFFGLVGINLLFLATCIPIVTIPASICALNRYLMIMVRDGYGFSVKDYFGEWKSELLRSLPVGAGIALLLFYASYLYSMALQVEGGDWLRLAAFLIFDIILLFGNYVFLLMANLSLRVRDALRNSILLMLIEWKTSFLLLVLGSSLLMLVLLFFPWSVLTAPFIPVLYQLAVCCILNGPVERRILEPYLKQNESI